MKGTIYYSLLAIIFVLVGWFANTLYHMPKTSNPIAQIKPTPLTKYTIENLAKANITPIQIQIGDEIKPTTLQTNPKYTSYKFYINFDPTLTNSQIKKVSGLINIPNGEGPFPIIVMIRGYVDPKDYFSGNGTFASSKFFADNGFITIAPDFLGYGESDKEPDNVFEARFQTYTTVMTLLKSINSIQGWDGKNAFIWAHSNGGQIALTVLEITKSTLPTVLWAPVSMPFPGSILYYAFESDDQGKYLVSALEKFNETYDASKYSLTNYLSQIKASLEINQGTADTEVPYYITDYFDKKLKEATVEATYIKYPGNDHNMLPDWGTVIQNDLTFFQKHLK